MHKWEIALFIFFLIRYPTIYYSKLVKKSTLAEDTERANTMSLKLSEKAQVRNNAGSNLLDTCRHLRPQNGNRSYIS